MGLSQLLEQIMKKIVLAGFVCVLYFTYLPISATSTLSSGLSTSFTDPADSLQPVSNDQLPAHFIVDSLINCAKNYLGVPYRSGGRSGKGFDCSGFTSYVFSRFGFDIPRTSYEQASAGKAVNMAEMQKGDLIFFKGRNNRSKSIGHVGIVISAKGEKIKFIHASVNHGISIETIESTYYRPRFVKSVRLVDSILPVPEICSSIGFNTSLGNIK